MPNDSRRITDVEMAIDLLRFSTSEKNIIRIDPPKKDKPELVTFDYQSLCSRSIDLPIDKLFSVGDGGNITPLSQEFLCPDANLKSCKKVRCIAWQNSHCIKYQKPTHLLVGANQDGEFNHILASQVIPIPSNPHLDKTLDQMLEDLLIENEIETY